MIAAIAIAALLAASNAQLTPGEAPYANPLAAPPTGIANGEKSGGWIVTPVNQANAKGETVPIGYALYTEYSGQPGALFRCNEGRLRAGLSVEGADFREVLTTHSFVSRKRAAFAVGHAAPAREDWIFLDRHKVAMPADPATAMRIYNAAAKGEPIRLSIAGRRNVEVTLPAPSAEAFGAFLESCGLSKRAASGDDAS